MQFSKWLKGINENPSSTPNNNNDDQMVEETQIKGKSKINSKKFKLFKSTFVDLCDICRRVTSLLCRNGFPS